jgi:hypothetical protein
LLQYLQEEDMLDNYDIVSATVPNKGIRKDVSSGALVEFCRVKTGVKLVWITGVRFETGV